MTNDNEGLFTKEEKQRVLEACAKMVVMSDVELPMLKERIAAHSVDRKHEHHEVQKKIESLADKQQLTKEELLDRIKSSELAIMSTFLLALRTRRSFTPPPSIIVVTVLGSSQLLRAIR